MAIVALPPGELYQGKWRIADPSKIVPVARTEFLQSLCGEYEHSTPLEDIDLSRKRDAKAALLRQLQTFYKQIKAINGRLPKFSKWCSSLLPNDKDLHQYISKLGQEATPRKIVISCDPVDILRAGTTPHFYSCLKWEDRGGDNWIANWDYIIPKIVETCPGIAVAYTDDEKGFMLSRSFVMHARDVKTQEDVLVVQTPKGSSMTTRQIAGAVADKTKVYEASYYGAPPKGTQVEFVGGITDPAVHFDIKTWEKLVVAPINP